MTGCGSGPRGRIKERDVIALAESLGVPFAEKRMRYRPTELWSNLLLGPNLLGISRVCAGQLRPPWPKLVISAGRRNEPVARWIRQQAGPAVRLVHVGRPWARPERYDLIISTPQYCLDRYPNVMIFELPLAEVIYDFYDKLKTVTQGYGSFDYDLAGYRESDLVKLDILVNGEKVDPLAMYLEDVFTVTANLAGLPALAVPVGLGTAGLWWAGFTFVTAVRLREAPSIEALHAQLADPELYRDNAERVPELKKQLSIRESELEQVFERWEELEVLGDID